MGIVFAGKGTRGHAHQDSESEVALHDVARVVGCVMNVSVLNEVASGEGSVRSGRRRQVSVSSLL